MSARSLVPARDCARIEASLVVLAGRGAAVVPLKLPLMRSRPLPRRIARRGRATIHAERMRKHRTISQTHINTRLFASLAVPATYYIETLSRRGPILKSVRDGGLRSGRSSGRTHHPHLPLLDRGRGG
jgi:hypothetical protein